MSRITNTRDRATVDTNTNNSTRTFVNDMCAQCTRDRREAEKRGGTVRQSLLFVGGNSSGSLHTGKGAAIGPATGRTAPSPRRGWPGPIHDRGPKPQEKPHGRPPDCPPAVSEKQAGAGRNAYHGLRSESESPASRRFPPPPAAAPVRRSTRKVARISLTSA